MARTILGRHGGEIEKFIGDAVVAFFGLREVHEDARCERCVRRSNYATR